VEAEPRNTIRERVTAGLMMSNTQGRIYPVFFEKQNSFSDSVMIEASGMMEYQDASTSFRIAPPDAPGSVVSKGSSLNLNTTNCLLSGTGPLRTGMTSGNLNLETWGTVSHYILPDSTAMSVAMAMNFPFNEEALEKLRQHLNSINLKGVTLLATPFGVALNSLAPRNDLNNLRTEIEQFGRFRRFPDELKRTLFLSEVRMSWDSISKAWVSNGPIGIGSVGDQLVPRYAEGKIEFAKKRNGDDFTIYLKLSEDDWYFFNYRNNILQTISSNLEYNDLIIKAQQDNGEQKRVDKAAKGFRYTISTERKKRDFIRKFENPEQ
jgi:hypothetical protein